MAKRAVQVQATTFTAQCPCGGDVVDAHGSYQLTGEGAMFCDTCDDEIIVSVKTARLSVN